MNSVKFTCASVNETSQTIRTSQLSFSGFNFKDGQEYKLTFENGKTAVGKISRNGTTLYISSANFPSGLKRAQVGSPVLRKIKSIKKL